MHKLPYLASLRNMLCVLALAGLIPLLSSTAEAQSGLYLAADVGLARGSTTDFGSEVSGGDIDLKSGLGYSLALGLGWQGLRLEGEATWRQTDIDAIDYDSLTVGGHPIVGDVLGRVNRQLNLKGTRTTLGFMANAWYDLDLGLGLAPYFGGGLGVNYVRYDIDLPVELPASVDSQLGLPPGTAGILNNLAGDGGDWVLAYQVGLGLGYRLLDSLVLHLGYRYKGAGDAKVKWGYGGAAKSEVQNHVFRAGIRIGF